MNKHNEGYKNGEHTFTMGINQFSDGTRPARGLITPQQFQQAKQEYLAQQALEEQPENVQNLIPKIVLEQN